MIKTLVAEDSMTTAEYVKYILESTGKFKVLSIAKDGNEAVSLCSKLDPDVVLMDINMPHKNGYEATREIMEEHPKPTVIFSASWNPQQVDMTFRAMEAGALAVLEKPPGPGSPDHERLVNELITTLALMAEVPVVRRWRKTRTLDSVVHKPKPALRTTRREKPELIAMGASTGGPPTLNRILSKLPGDFPVPIIVVQHISQGFLEGLTDWLNRTCPLNIKIAKHLEKLESGNVYLAPDKLHTGVSRNGQIKLDDSPPIHGVRPAVSYLFNSAAAIYGKQAVGVLLTGMGKDGAQELALLKDAGGITIAQDEKSSVVHGMPGEAIKLGAVKHVLDPEAIADMLISIGQEGISIGGDNDR